MNEADLIKPLRRAAGTGQASRTAPRADNDNKSGQRQSLRQLLACAEGFLEKNVRDLPRFIREYEPDGRHVIRADDSAAEILDWVCWAALPQLLQRCERLLNPAQLICELLGFEQIRGCQGAVGGTLQAANCCWADEPTLVPPQQSRRV